MRSQLANAVLALASCAAPVAAQNQIEGEIPRAPYFRAGPEQMLEAYPRGIVSRIFSGEFTEMRRTKVMSTLAGAPGMNCPERPNIVAYAMIPFNLKNGKTTWIERYAIGCDPAAGRNFMAILDQNGLQLLELTRGGTRTDPFLQRDLSPVVSGLARAKAPQGCQRFVVADSRITEQPQQGSGFWRERWSVAVCAVSFQLDITFTPSPAGGTTWNIKEVE